MKLLRNNQICSEDFSNLDFGNIRLDGIAFSSGGRFPSSFCGCIMNQFNFRSGHFEWVTFVRFSPDSRRIITGSNDGTAIVWNTDSGLIISRLERPFEKMISGALLSDNVHAVTLSMNQLSAEKHIMIWNTDDGALLSQLKIRSSPFTKKDFTYSWVNTKLLEEINACIKYKHNSFIHLKNIKEVITSSSIPLFTIHNGMRILNTDALMMTELIKQVEWESMNPALWNEKTAECVQVFYGHQAPVLDMDITSDEKFLISCSEDHSAIIWDIQNGRPFKMLSVNMQKVSALAFSPDAKYYIAGSYGTIANMMCSKDGQIIKNFTCMQSGTSSAVFTPDGKSVIISSWDHNVYVIDTNSYAVCSLQHSSAVVSVTANDRRIVSCDYNGGIRLYDRKTLYPFSGH